MSVIDRIEESFNAAPRGRAEVPEWGSPGAPLVVTWSMLTPMELSRAQRKAGGAGKVDQFRLACWLIVIKALDERGERLFADEDVHRLMRRGGQVVIDRIASAMLGAQDEDAVAALVEDAEKN